METTELLTIRELAALLKVGVSTCWRLRAAGKLPLPLRVGGAIRWRASEVAEWIACDCPPLATWQAMRE